MMDAARACGATIVQTVFHSFNPQGVSGVVVIAESHLAIHTWPEYGHAAVDVFTCGDSIDPWIAVDRLKEGLGAGRIHTREVPRILLPAGAVARGAPAGTSGGEFVPEVESASPD